MFLKFNDNNISIDSFKDHNNIQILKPIINRQKLNNNLKKKTLNIIYVWTKNICVSIYKNIPRLQFTYAYCVKYTQDVIYICIKLYTGWNLHIQFEMGRNLQRSVKIIPVKFLILIKKKEEESIFNYYFKQNIMKHNYTILYI